MRPMLERVLILWSGQQVTQDEILPLLNKARPGASLDRVVISVYQGPSDLGVAQAMVFRLMSKGELRPGALDRMHTVTLGTRLVVLIESAQQHEQQERYEPEYGQRYQDDSLHDGLEKLARSLVGFVDKTAGMPFGWITRARVRRIGIKLNRAGGTRKMRVVADRVAALSYCPSAAQLIRSTWHGIGDWQERP